VGVFYRSAFVLSCHEPSQEHYRWKQAEGKGAPQAIMALTRRRVNVLWAILGTEVSTSTGQPRGLEESVGITFPSWKRVWLWVRGPVEKARLLSRAPLLLSLEAVASLT
jgi:hypothetical protein